MLDAEEYCRRVVKEIKRRAAQRRTDIEVLGFGMLTETEKDREMLIAEVERLQKVKGRSP